MKISGLCSSLKDDNELVEIGLRFGEEDAESSGETVTSIIQSGGRFSGVAFGRRIILHFRGWLKFAIRLTFRVWSFVREFRFWARGMGGGQGVTALRVWEIDLFADL